MPNPRIEVVIEAVTRGFDQVVQELQRLEQTMRGVQTSVPVTAVQQLSSQMQSLSGQLSAATAAMNAFGTSTRQGAIGLNQLNRLTMQWDIKSFIGDMEKMLAVQLRWYAARALIFTPIQMTISGTKEIIEYAAALDQSRSEMLRWQATTGSLTTQNYQEADRIVIQIRKNLTQLPLDLKTYSDAVQAFISAGVPMDVTADMVRNIGRLKIAFKEIDFNQFAVSLTGAFNVFRDKLVGARDDAEAFQMIMEKILRAQAVGIIRPEQFTKVTAYLGEIGKIAGFDLDQLLAMSVAVTDTGIQASNAARLLAGMMLSLTQPKAREELRRIGIEIDRNQSLASQFDSLMTQLKSKIAGGEAVPSGWLEFFGGLTSADRLKAMTTLIDRFEQYKSLIGDIADAQGGLKSASDIMTAPIPAQWQILKNIWLEIGNNALGTENILKGFLFVINDVSNGILAAVDKTGMWAENLNKLGPAGKAAYDTIRGISDAFRDMGAAISFVWGYLGPLIEKINALLPNFNLLKTVIEGLTILLVARLAGAVFGVIGSFGAWVISILSVIKNLSYLANVTLPLLLARLGPVGVALLALGAAAGAYFAYQGSQKTPIEESLEYRSTLNNKSKADLEKDITFYKNQLAELDAAKEKSVEVSKTVKEEEDSLSLMGGEVYEKTPVPIDTEKKREALRLKLEAAQAEMEVRDAQQKVRDLLRQQQQGTGTGELPPAEKEKGRLGALRGLIGAEKSILQAEYQKIRMVEQEHVQEIDRIHQAGLMSDEQWSESRIAIAQQAYQDQVAILDREKRLIQQEYATLLAEPGLKPTERAAILARQRADMLQIENKYIQAATTLNKLEVDTEIRNYQRGLQQWTQFENTRLQLHQSFISARENLTAAHLDRVRAILDAEYSEMKTISATEYFAGRENLIQAETQNQLSSIRQRQEAWRSFHAQQLEEYRENTQVRAQLELEGFRTEQQFSLERLKVQSDAVTKINQMMIERAKDPQWVYEYTKNFTVLIVEMNKVAAEWQKVGLHLVNIAKGTADAISGTFESMLNDLYDNKFKKFSDYVNAFMKDISKTVFKAISQHFTGMLIQGTFKLLGIEVPDLLKGAKQFMQAQLVNIQAQLVNLEGQIPEGRLPPEIPVGETPIGHPSEHLPAGSPEAMAQDAQVLAGEEMVGPLSKVTSELPTEIYSSLATGATELVTSLNTTFTEAVTSLTAWGDSLVSALEMASVSSEGEGFLGEIEEGKGLFDLASAAKGAAKGAKVSPKQPFIVGEEGPELFIPDAAGTIVPQQTQEYTPTEFKPPAAYVDDMGYALTDVGQAQRKEAEDKYRADYYKQKEEEAKSRQEKESASGGNPLMQIGMIIGGLYSLAKGFGDFGDKVKKAFGMDDSTGWAPEGHPQSHEEAGGSSVPEFGIPAETSEAEDISAALSEGSTEISSSIEGAMAYGGTSVEGNLINSFSMGVSALSGWGDSFYKMISSLVSSMSGGGGGGGLFGSLGSLFSGGGASGAEASFGANELLTWAAMAHTGRQAYGDFPSYKLVPAGVFAGAPRRHAGNLSPNERAVIITDDEHIVPNNKTSRSSGDSPQSQQPVIVQFNVSTFDSASFGAYVHENRKAIANAILSAQGDNHRARRGR